MDGPQVSKCIDILYTYQLKVLFEARYIFG